MGADLRRLTTLPEAAQRRFWEALGPSLQDPLPSDIEQRLTDFCRRYELGDEDVAYAIKACRHLLRAAAAVDLDANRFAEDVRQLMAPGESSRVQAILLAGFDSAKTLLRGEIAKRTLSSIEDLVTSMDSRVERIVSSNHGDNLQLGLLALTLRKGKVGREEVVTVRLSREHVEELRRACERALR